MRSISVLFSLCTLALISCTVPKEPDRAKLSETVLATLNKYSEAVNAGRFEEAADYYLDSADFYWIENEALRYDSADAARQSLSSLADYGLRPAVRYTEAHISLLGSDAAIASLKFETVFTNPDGGSFSFDGWQTAGLVRTAEGWKIAGGHTETIEPEN